MKTPRPFQATAVAEAVDAINAGSRPRVLVSPTGSGKTVMGLLAVKHFLERGYSCIWGVHRDHLVHQTAAQARDMGLSFGIIKSGVPPSTHEPFQIASVHTATRREWPKAQLVVGDETHVRTIQQMMALPEYERSAKLGLTATPEMYGGETLHETYAVMQVAAQPSELLRDRYITDCRIWVPHAPDMSHVRLINGDFSEKDAEKAMNQRGILAGAVQNWLDLARGKPTIAFTCGRAHSEALALEFRSHRVSCAIIDGDTPDAARALIMAQMASRKIDVLINVSVFCEGYDLPMLECVLMLRPTQSLSAFLQMCGRGCRPGAGKDSYLLLDHAGNVLRPGHGRPHRDRPWTLDPGLAKRARAALGELVVRRCPACAFLYEKGSHCPQCGTTKSARFVTERKGKLVEVTDEELAGPALLSPAEQTKEAATKYRQSLYAKMRAVGLKGPALEVKVNEGMKGFWKSLAQKESIMRDGR